MTYGEVIKEIHSFFLANHTRVEPVAFEGEHYNEALSTWMRLVVRQTSSIQDTLGQLGNRNYERRGVVVVSIFTPTDTGRATLDLLTDYITGIFEGRRIASTSICFLDATVTELGQDGPYLSGNVTVSFTYTEKK